MRCDAYLRDLLYIPMYIFILLYIIYYTVLMDNHAELTDLVEQFKMACINKDAVTMFLRNPDMEKQKQSMLTFETIIPKLKEKEWRGYTYYQYSLLYLSMLYVRHKDNKDVFSIDKYYDVYSDMIFEWRTEVYRNNDDTDYHNRKYTVGSVLKFKQPNPTSNKKDLDRFMVYTGDGYGITLDNVKRVSKLIEVPEDAVRVNQYYGSGVYTSAVASITKEQGKVYDSSMANEEFCKKCFNEANLIKKHVELVVKEYHDLIMRNVSMGKSELLREQSFNYLSNSLTWVKDYTRHIQEYAVYFKLICLSRSDVQQKMNEVMEDMSTTLLKLYKATMPFRKTLPTPAYNNLTKGIFNFVEIYIDIIVYPFDVFSSPIYMHQLIQRVYSIYALDRHHTVLYVLCMVMLLLLETSFNSYESLLSYLYDGVLKGAARMQDENPEMSSAVRSVVEPLVDAVRDKSKARFLDGMRNLHCEFDDVGRVVVDVCMMVKIYKVSL